MEFSLAWLAEYVDLDLPAAGSPEADWHRRARSLADLLTGIGHAVEGERTVAGADGVEDLVLDVDVTSNRPDCMNHLGLARELAAKLGLALRAPEVALPATGAGPVAVRLDDPHGCPRYVGLTVTGVRVAPSPAWLVRRLAAIGQRAINNVVDITNFVLWEFGQPLHAFDLERLAGGQIVVRRARAGERLVTLDGVERELDPEVLVIADRERAVALAGIMGGRDSEVTATTTRVLLESAHFDRRRVRRGAARLGMHTDASHRFERGTDWRGCLAAAARAARLLVECAGGTIVEPAADAVGEAIPSIPWRIESQRLSAFAGLAVTDLEIERPLAALGFAPRRIAAGVFSGEVPSFRRHDFEPREVEREGTRGREAYPQDLYEEVLRIAGFDRLPATLPALGAPDSGSSAEHELATRVRHELAARGYAEAIHYAFQDLAADARFARLVADGEPQALASPISERYAVMRRSLLPNLVESAAFNARRGALSVRLFEVGHLFPPGAGDEIEAVALVAGGILGRPWDRPANLDLFDLKGVVESLAEAFGVALEARPAPLAGFVAGACAELLSEGARVGHLGRVVGEETPFPLFAAELLTAALAPRERPTLRVALPPRLPGIAADLTLTHRLEVAWSEVAAAIDAARPAELARFELKDRYRGPGVPEGAVNSTITFHYSAPERTLTQEEVNDRQLALASLLSHRFGLAESSPR